MLIETEWLGHGIDDVLSDPPQVRHVVHPRQDGDELVAAQPGYGIGFANAGAYALSGFHQ